MAKEDSEIVKTRRKRLKEWINIHYEGIQAAFVEKTGINQGEASGLLKTKSFGEKKARSLELLADMPEKWLDGDESKSLQDVKSIYNTSGFSVPGVKVIKTRCIDWSDYCQSPGSITKIKELDLMTIKKDTIIFGELFAIDIDSNLFKDFPAGTRLLFDTKKLPEKTKVVLISIGGEKPTLVRWCPGFGKLNVQPLETGQPETVTLEEENITVHGVAIAIGTKTTMI